MSEHSSNKSLYRWSFTLMDEIPGPSTGDAAEHIEALGFDPWEFRSLDLVNETLVGGEYFAQFDLVGPRPMVEELRRAHDRATLSTSAPPHAVGLAWVDSRDS